MNEALFTVNNLWILMATVLVFIMHLGFATLEAGFVQKKNVVNILFKNAMIIAIGLLTYFVIGFNLMYPGTNEGGWLAFSGFIATAPDMAPIAYADGAYSYWTDFIFQAMFAATAATIVSGAVAERIKLGSFLIFSMFLVALAYPIVGFWKWGGGWLDAAGFQDFAGSTLVHAFGGAAALAAAIVLGPRVGKYRKGKPQAIPGHSMPLAAMGVFLLWFGWFGFNGGSVLSADPNMVPLVFVTTSLAAAAGAVGSFFVSWLMFKTHDLSMVLNGILGGLVGITAGADVISPAFAILVGAVAGMIIPLSVVMFDKLRIDDPVGATSVHLICGVWGTLAVGLFGANASLSLLWVQLYGCVACVLFAFTFSFGAMYLLKITLGIRVSKKEETIGLDVGEHDMEAYSEPMEEGSLVLSTIK